MKNTGMKAHAVVTDAARTGQSMARAPMTEASREGTPRSHCICPCSATTIASSTTIPSIMIMANMLIMLMDCPERYIANRVAANAAGMPTATQNAVRGLRNTNRMIRTSASPPRPFRTSMSSRLTTPSASIRKSVSSRSSGRPSRSPLR